MNNDPKSNLLDSIIRTRRTVKPDRMNGRLIDDTVVEELLESANWAPTHAKTEPWRFVVFTSSKVKEFTRRHAELYKQFADPATFTQAKYQNIENLGNNVSHIIIAWMKRVPSHKIPEIEEIAATAAAVQNLLLSAASRGIASFWSTGGLTHHPALHQELGLDEEDKIMGILYLGYTDQEFGEGTRLTPVSEKTEWVR